VEAAINASTEWLTDGGAAGEARPDSTGTADASPGCVSQHYSSPEALFVCEYASLSRALSLVAGNMEAAEDAVQEAFAQLCKNWSKVAAYDDQAAWVRRVAINRAIDQKRSLARRAGAILRLGGEPAFSPQAQLPDSDLTRALRRLPLKQRTAVGLYYLADLSVVEVAKSMGVSEGTVKRHLARAREALRSTLQAGEP
jgi:RNA polymerase sigma-70 factor (ECF subfamily)